jgi:lipopolysaccharide export system ATP-binding protein
MPQSISLFSRMSGRLQQKPAAPSLRPDADKFKGTLIAHGLTKSYKGRRWSTAFRSASGLARRSGC